MSDVKFYIKHDYESGYVSIEDTFLGVKYLRCKGLEDKGKPKNKYTETYADSGELRLYEPQEVLLEATDVVFTFVFVGDKRQYIYDEFCKYIQNGRFHYYDTKRNKLALLTLLEAVKPSDDVYVGSLPYIQADFKFKNLWGECKPYTNN